MVSPRGQSHGKRGATGQRLLMRAARQDDLSAVCALEQKCFTMHRLSKRQLRYLCGRETVIFHVASVGGKIVGEAIGLMRRHGKRLSGRIYSLAVDPEYRGRSIGLRLLGRIMRGFHALGVGRVYLEVDRDNEPAIQLYRRHGFCGMEELPDYYGPGGHALRMRRQGQVR
jgi:ribosomal protein S18 acetylase RimI-like enzyme